MVVGGGILSLFTDSRRTGRQLLHTLVEILPSHDVISKPK